MNYEMLTGPIVGTVVGYCTNYIAVKMLFRPLKPVKIGKHTLPFTPGIIPKGKTRLAKALGQMVGGTLVTKKDFREILFSDDVSSKIKESINNYIDSLVKEDKTIQDVLSLFLNDNYSMISDIVSKKISDKIMISINEVDIANVVSTQIIDAVKEKVQGSILQMMVNDSMLESFRAPMEEKINNYIANEGKDMVDKKVKTECDNISNMAVVVLVEKLEKNNIDLSDIIVGVYEKIIEEKFEDIIQYFDVESIVEEKILDMDVLELEKLIMTVMKKELNAIVNLGALIGFILGLVTVFVK